QGYGNMERTRGGLGIGLTLVRTLIHLHGGSVEAYSAGRGEGSTFTVRLPRADSRAEHDPAALRTPRGELRRRRILLVDDNEDALILLGDALVAQGHDVRTALDPRAALDAARAFQPEVAILDIGLPDMDGYELGAQLRVTLGDSVSLIALTGY